MLTQLPSGESRFNPSATPAYLPAAEDSFEFYVEENRSRIRAVLAEYYFTDSDTPFGPGYSIDRVLDMRSPYQLSPEAGTCQSGEGNNAKGFLLVHGLTDSPYLLRKVGESLAAAYPCALVRGLLSPGHGTIPGDLLNVRVQQWLTTIEFGINSFAGKVDELHVVGYSNGRALALNFLDNNRLENSVTSLILLSPGLETLDKRAYLTPYLR